jgi:hypothetical protein
MTAELRSINSGPIRRALDRVDKLFQQIGAGNGNSDNVSLVIDPVYAGPWRTSATVTDKNTAQIGNILGGQLKEGLMLDASGFLRFYSQKGIPTGGSQIQFLELAPDHITQTWVASLIQDKFQVGDINFGRHPVHQMYGLWIQSEVGTSGQNYLIMRGGDGSLYLDATAGNTIYLRQNNANMMTVQAARTGTSGGITVNWDSPDGQWPNAHYLSYPTGAGQQSRIAFHSPGVAPQLRGLAADGEQLVAINNVASTYCPVGASAFNTLSTATIKRDIRPLRDVERIVVRHDVRADLVPEPDIMSLRPVAFRPKVPALRIIPTKGDSYDPADPDSWESVPEVGILGHEGTRERLGLIAEEVETVIPSAVTHNIDGDTRAIDYAQITVALLDHVQRLTDEVATLRYRIAELEGTA